MNFLKRKFSLGFTLPEMMISIAIIAAIASVVVFNYTKFNDNLEITNLAYEVALSIRQAQVYGISVKEFQGEFTNAYGVFFDVRSSVSQKYFVLFSDSNGNQIYDGTDNGATCTGGECLEVSTIGRGNKIDKFCGTQNNTEYCPPSDIEILTLLFKRPNPDAIIKFYNSENQPQGGLIYSSAAVCLISPQGKVKKVKVYPTGQISVEDGTC